MAKQSGLGWTTCSVDDSSGSLTAIVNDVTNIDFATPRAVQDVTGMDKSAIERILLLADFSVNINGVFNTAVSHPVFKTIPTTSTLRTVTLVVAAQTLSNECILTDYPLTRSASGELTWQVPGVLANGTAPSWS
jgi:hypothetical protein